MQHATIFSEQLLHAASQAMGVARQQPKQSPQLAQRAALTTRLEEQSSSEAQSSDAGMHPSDPSLDEQRARNNRLRDLIIEGRTDEAWALFDGWMAMGQGNGHTVATMLRACKNSAQQRDLLRKCQRRGVPPHVSSHTMLLSRLRFEGREIEARALRAEMEQLGMEDDGHLRRVLSRTHEDLSKQRTKGLVSLLSAGREEEAWELFQGLLHRGCADNYLLSSMLRACRSSTRQRDLVQRARNFGVEPGMSTYNQVLSSMRLEGREQEATELWWELTRSGPAPDEATRAIFAREEAELSKARTSRLLKLLSEGHTADAFELFNGLLARRQADAYQVSAILKGCPTSGEQRARLLRSEAGGATPATSSFNVLAHQLRLEGREDEARQLPEEMRARGLEPDAFTAAAMGAPLNGGSNSGTSRSRNARPRRRHP
jgi:pentatricopeptide repeat protein